MDAPSPVRVWSMPLPAFLETYEPAYFEGISWQDIPEHMATSPGDMDVVNALRAVLRSGADFDEPIRVYDTIDSDDGEDVRHVGNGMHRIVAAILEGKEFVTVTDGYVHDGVPVIAVQFTLSPDRHGFASEDDYEKALDDLLSWIRSFPLNDVTWVTCDGFSTEGKAWLGSWYCPLDLLDSLAQAVISRINEKSLFTATLVSAEHDPLYGVQDDEDAD